MKLKDFLNPDCTKSILSPYIAGGFKGRVQSSEKPGWLSVEPMEGWLDGVSQKKVAESYLDKTEITGNEPGYYSDSLEIATPEGKCEITVPVYTGNLQDKKNVFVGYNGVSQHRSGTLCKFCSGNYKDRQVKFENLQGYGKTNSAMKAFPSDARTVRDRMRRIWSINLFWKKAEHMKQNSICSHPIRLPERINFLCGQINEEMTETVNAVEKDYQVGDQAEKWAEGVLESDSKTNSFDKMQSRVQYTSGLSCM